MGQTGKPNWLGITYKIGNDSTIIIVIIILLSDPALTILSKVMILERGVVVSYCMSIIVNGGVFSN